MISAGRPSGQPCQNLHVTRMSRHQSCVITHAGLFLFLLIKFCLFVVVVVVVGGGGGGGGCVCVCVCVHACVFMCVYVFGDWEGMIIYLT